MPLRRLKSPWGWNPRHKFVILLWRDCGAEALRGRFDSTTSTTSTLYMTLHAHLKYLCWGQNLRTWRAHRAHPHCPHPSVALSCLTWILPPTLTAWGCGSTPAWPANKWKRYEKIQNTYETYDFIRSYEVIRIKGELSTREIECPGCLYWSTKHEQQNWNLAHKKRS